MKLSKRDRMIIAARIMQHADSNKLISLLSLRQILQKSKDPHYSDALTNNYDELHQLVCDTIAYKMYNLKDLIWYIFAPEFYSKAITDILIYDFKSDIKKLNNVLCIPNSIINDIKV